MNFDLLTLVLLAFAVIGIIEWFKVILEAIEKRKPGAIGLSVLSLVASFVVGLSSSLGASFSQGVVVSFVLLATVQLCYQLIIQTFQGLIRRLLAPPDAPTKT